MAIPRVNDEPAASRSPVLAAPLRVATFNLRHGAPEGRRVDLRGVRRAVARLGADLIALQEVDRGVGRSWFVDEAALVARAAGLHPTFAAARRLGVSGSYGIALLTRRPPTAVQVLRLPAFGSEQRVAIIASVPVGGARLSVAATHLQNRAWIAQRQLPVVLEALGRRPGPHLLLGDLNAGDEELGDMVAAAGLTRLEAPPTFPTRGATDHIDWIAAGGLTFGEPEVPSIWASDHFPLVTTVR